MSRMRHMLLLLIIMMIVWDINDSDSDNGTDVTVAFFGNYAHLC
jgi:hypothetical protein